MAQALIDLNAQLRLDRTQRGYTWSITVPVVGLGLASFEDALNIALSVDARLTAQYGEIVAEPGKAGK